MKKLTPIFLIILSICIIVVGIGGYYLSHKEKPFDLNRLLPYIEKDDNYLSVKKYYATSYKISDNKLTITFKNNDHKGKLIGTLENNIISFDIKSDDENALVKAMLIYAIADSIGQINGNEKNYVSSMISSIDIGSVTLEDQGIELSTKDNINTYRFKVNQKFELGDINNIYLEIKDLEEYKDILNGDGFVQTTKANLVFYKSYIHSKNVIYICEPNKLTVRTYNSLLSFIELMYGSDYKNEFIKNYPNLISSNVLNKFNIIVDYQPEEEELVKNIITENYKIIKVTIEN